MANAYRAQKRGALAQSLPMGPHPEPLWGDFPGHAEGAAVGAVRRAEWRMPIAPHTKSTTSCR